MPPLVERQARSAPRQREAQGPTRQMPVTPIRFGSRPAGSNLRRNRSEKGPVTVIPEELPLTPEEIGRLIKASGRNQKSLAAELGVREATVSQWVTGSGSPSRDNADKLRALKPLPVAQREWVAYLADVRARVAQLKNADAPFVAVDPEPIAVRVAAVVGTASEIASSVKSIIPTASEVADAVRTAIPSASQVADAVRSTVPTPRELADAVKSVIPSATEVADAVKAAVPVPTVREVAAEVQATLPKPADAATLSAADAPFLKPLKVTAAIVISTVVLGVGAMIALAFHAYAAPERDLARVTQPPPVRGVATGVTGRGFDLRTFLGALLNLGKKVQENWIPKEPFPGQKDAKDCDPDLGETPINGGCWVPIRNMVPPCAKLFRHGDGCYRPVSADPQKPVGVFPDVPHQPREPGR
ncbi:MAG TPA: helix-turn-helix domain-containing protein [Myxococcaceae bacterium]|nr:helix-turn-helix domain-containing protein [Myxococcaceae bacterium]